MSRRRKKRLTITFASLIILLLGVGSIIHFAAPYAIIRPFRAECPVHPDQFEMPNESLSIQTKDGSELVGYLVQPANKPVEGVMILVHGIGGCKEGYLGLADRLSRIGVASFLFDNRAQGKSDGPYCTYGFQEKYDIQQIVSLAQSRFPETPIGIWGNSLGGAISLQSLAIDSRIKFGIVESTFSNLEEVVFDYKKRYLKGFGIRWVSDYVLKRAGKIAGFQPTAVRPESAAANIKQPLLLTHGDKDPNINISHGRRIANNLQYDNQHFIVVPGGGHSNLFNAGGPGYAERIMSFIQTQLQTQKSK